MNNTKGRITFLRQDGHKKLRLGRKWRKPKGIHSKMRLCHMGFRRMPRVGFGTAAELRGSEKKTGLKRVMVSSLGDLKRIDSKTQGIIIANALGMQKRLELVRHAKAAGITILNVKDADAFIAQAEKEFLQRKQEKAESAKKKTEKRKENEKKKPKKTIEEKVEKSDEERKEEEKREKDKLLTQRSV